MNLADLFTPTGLTSIVSLGVASLAFLGSLRSFRSVRQLRFRNLDERSKAVGFWKAWIETQEKVASPEELQAHRATVQRELDDLAAFLTVEAATSRPAPLRAFFLLRKPRMPLTWVLQGPFYLAAAAAAGYAAFGLADLAARPISAERLMTYLGSLLVFLFGAGILRGAALLLDSFGRPRGV